MNHPRKRIYLENDMEPKTEENTITDLAMPSSVFPVAPTIDFTLPADIRNFRIEMAKLQNTFEEIQAVLLQTAKAPEKKKMYYLSNATRSALMTRLWAGKLLQAWGISTPYKKGDDITTLVVNNPTDETEEDFGMEGQNLIIVTKAMRSYIGVFQDRVEYTFDMPLSFEIRYPLNVVYQYLVETKMFLGLFLGEIGVKEEVAAPEPTARGPVAKPIAIDDVMVNKYVLQYAEGKTNKEELFGLLAELFRSAFVKAGYTDLVGAEDMLNSFIAADDRLTPIFFPLQSGTDPGKEPVVDKAPENSLIVPDTQEQADAGKPKSAKKK